MKAVVFTQFQTFPSLLEVERPEPGPGEVLLKVAGAGACHSDMGILQEFESDPTGCLTPPFVLGHETSGWVEEVGADVAGVGLGEAYLVYGPSGCGRCPACARGQDPYCARRRTAGHLAYGLGRNGGMAEYVRVSARNLVPLGDAVDAVAAAPLADAGLSPYHAIKRAMPHLALAGSSALVIGLGGLGMMAVQMLTALTGARVIATDPQPVACAQAEQYGARTIPGTGDLTTRELAARVRELNEGNRTDAVFDFVGVDATIALAAACVQQCGSISVLGIGGGSFAWSYLSVPYEVNFASTYWGSLAELHEVVALYRAGRIVPTIERFSLGNALEAYRRLRDGELTARAVVVPHGAPAD